jgi:hypothetical protein
VPLCDHGAPVDALEQLRPVLYISSRAIIHYFGFA